MPGSVDKMAQLWDLRAPTFRGLLNLPASPIVTCDSGGLVFAVGMNHYSRMLLYDQASYDKDPFSTITLEDSILAQSEQRDCRAYGRNVLLIGFVSAIGP
jgi:COMPASS component SWD2